MYNRFFVLSATAAVGLLAVIGFGFYLSTLGECLDFSKSSIQTPIKNLRVGVATTKQQQVRGLAGCKEVPQDAGLYFLYENPQIVSFWMKGMKIPIDIVWIFEGKVIGVEDYVSPPVSAALDQELPLYKPPRAVDAVLEVGAGKAKEYGLTPGVTVQYLP